VPDDLLPAVPSASVEEVVYDGEVVDEAATAAAGAVAASPDGPGRSRTVSAILRHLGYVAAGVVVAWRRWRHRRTRHERTLRALEAQGNHEAMLAWQQHAELARKQRHDRRRAWATAAVELLKASPWIAAAGLALVILAGLLTAVSMRSWYGFIVPWLEAARLFTLTEQVMRDATWGVLAAPPAIVAGLWQLGRTGGNMAPGWLATSAGPDIDVSIDEVTITQALANLRIPQVTDYLKQSLPLQFLVPCRQEGRGTYAEVRLPGVPADKVARRRPDLAAGLHRLAKEVFPSVGSEAAILKLWIADKGALEEGAGPYPLAEGGFTDVFKGLPFGRTLRGDPIRIPVIGRNSICGGAPEQGKSNGARVTAAGYTLDITTELRIFVPDLNYDFEPFRPRCARYLMGAEDEHIEAILAELEWLHEEIQRRGQLLIDHEQQEVTRELAHANVGLHPLFWLLEEAHVAISHPRHGKDVGRLLGENVRLDRKRGIHMMVSTQAPTKDSMPRDVTRNCTVGIAFAVGDHVANDALLGQGAYRSGHRATELIPGVDRGTALCKGFSGERSEMVQVHKLDSKSDNDQVSPLVNRALAEMARKGRELPGSGLPMLESRDLLADLAEVTRDATGRVNVADLPPRLRKLAPAWSAYRQLTGVQLRQLLEVEGVRVYTTGGTLRVDPADLAAAATGTTDATSAGQGPAEPIDD
jgi:DNA segregation ATPase FtsK/SpoIIIE, S-DNA-T family